MATEEFGVEFFATGFAEMERALLAIERRGNSLQFALDDLADETKTTNIILGSLDKTLRELVSGMSKTDDETDDVANSVDNLGDKTEKSKDKMSGLNSFIRDTLSVAIGNILAKAIETAAQALVTLGAKTTEFLGDSFRSAVDFEVAITQLGLAAGKSGKEMEDLHDAAIAVGGASQLVGVDASQAAEAMTSLFKSGLTTTEVLGDLNAVMEDGNQATGALRASIDLAAATSLDMVQAADLASKLMATFGNDAKEAGINIEDWVVDAMDRLVKGANASITEVDALSQALNFVGPTAASAGLSLDETINALALLSSGGIEASTAGTNLRQMLNSLIAPTKEGSETLGVLGVSMFDGSGKSRDFTSVLKDLNQALFGVNEVTIEVGGRTEEQNAILNEAQKRYDQLTKRIQNHNAGLSTMSDKALAKANAELSNASAIIANLSGIQGQAVKTTKQLTDAEREQAIGNIFTTQGANALKVILQQLNETNKDGLDGWASMLQATDLATGMQDQAAAKAATFAGRMEALRGVIETLQIQIGEKFIASGTKLVTLFTELAEKYGPTIVDVFGRIANTVSLFGDTLLELLSGNPDEAISKLGLAFTEMFGVEKSAEFMLFLSKIPEIIEKIKESFVGKAIEGFINLIGKIPEIFDRIKSVGENVWGIITDVFKTVSDVFRENILPDILKISEKFSGLGIDWEFVGSIFSAVGIVISGIIIAIIGIVLALVDGVTSAAAAIIERLPAITEGFSTMWEGIKEFLLNISQAIMALFSGDMESAKKFFSSAIDGLLKIGEGFRTAFINIFMALVDAVVAHVSGFIDTLVKFFTNLYDELIGNSIIPDMIEKIISAFVQFGTDVLDNMAEFMTSLKEFVSSKMNELHDIFFTKLDDIKAMWSSKWVGIKDDLSANLDAIIGVVTTKAQDIYDKVTGKIAEIGTWITDSVETMKTWGENIISQIVTGIDGVIDDIKDAITNAINKISDGIEAAKETLKGFGTSIMSYITEGVSNAGDAISGAISTILSGITSAVQFGQEVISGLATIGAKIINLIISGLSNGASTLATAISDLIKKVFTDFLPDIINAVVDEVKARFGLGNIFPGGGPTPSTITPSSNTNYLFGQQAQIPLIDTSGRSQGNSITNNSTRNYNLTTQSLASPESLALEFETMSLMGR